MYDDLFVDNLGGMYLDNFLNFPLNFFWGGKQPWKTTNFGNYKLDKFNFNSL